MQLYMVPLAPNPTKVMLYIAEREQLGVHMHIEHSPSTWPATPLAPCLNWH